MARPNWEYIRVDVLLPDHPKLDGLSPLAKWTLVELWCHCGQHLTDGFVRQAKWKTFGTVHARRQILAAGLAVDVPGGYLMHDFTGDDGHQRSRAEVIALKEKRRRSGQKGGLAKAKQVLEQTLKQNSGKSLAEAEAEAEEPPNPPPSGGQRHAGQHENCRACGTNRRGPPAPPVPTPTPPPVADVLSGSSNGHVLAGEPPAAWTKARSAIKRKEVGGE